MTNTSRNNDILPTLVPVLRDRWFEPFRTPWRRRILSVLWAALTVATMVLITTDARALDVGMPALLVGVLLNVTMRNMADAPPNKLDERMVQVRDHTFRLAYNAVGVALVAGIGVALVFGKHPITVNKQQLIEIASSAGLVTMFLPAAILAWTEEVV